MGNLRKFKVFLFGAALACSFHYGASASPWAQVGDSQLRSDIEILANAGVLDNITTEWPIPWSSILTQLNERSLVEQPDYVVDAAQRVLSAGHTQSGTGFHGSLYADGTNDPNVVRGFDALGREDGQAQITAEYMGSSTAIGISAGAQYTHGTHQTNFMPDNSYVAQGIGGALLYGGYITHWWGPGWISALSLSNNARPFPQVGIERADSSAFQSPWLSWIGPWQADFFVGLLDGPRIDKNTIYDGLRVTINPLPGLELAVARTQEVCGDGHEGVTHPCNPLSEYFQFANDNTHRNATNDEGNIDLRYTNQLGGVPFEVYAQMMNEDSDPIVHSVTSHLFGGSLFIPIAASPLRLTAEYTDTIPTVDIFSFGDVLHGAAYNNDQYIDGMRYRGRTLGFSLDSDSRLMSVQGSWRAPNGISYTLTYNHADVSSSENTNINSVTTAPVTINMVVARISLPFRHFSVDLEGRFQDDQPRPSHGKTGAIEMALRVPF